MDSTKGGEKEKDQDPIFLDLRKMFISIEYQLRIRGFGLLKYHGMFCVPRVDGLQERIIEEAHSSRYSIYSGSRKMYRDLRELYWWEGKQKGIAESVCSQVPESQQVNVQHQRMGGLAKNIELLEWKWEMINVVFITGLPRSRRQHDSIWVTVD